RFEAGRRPAPYRTRMRLRINSANGPSSPAKLAIMTFISSGGCWRRLKSSGCPARAARIDARGRREAKGAGSSRRLEPRQFGREFKLQLRGFLLGQAAGHLREDGLVERRAVVVPRHRFRPAHLRKNGVQVGAHLLGIGIPGGRLALLGIVAAAEEVALT